MSLLPSDERCVLRAGDGGQVRKLVVSKEIKNTNLMGGTKRLGRESDGGAGRESQAPCISARTRTPAPDLCVPVFISSS